MDSVWGKSLTACRCDVPAQGGRIDPAVILDVLRVICQVSVQRRFWSNAWIERSAVLTSIGDRVRRHRPNGRIAADEGWWENRDLTVHFAWIRLDLQALVEDHGCGRCLCRFRVRSRMSGLIITTIAAAIALIANPGAAATGWLLVGAALVVVVRDALVAYRLFSDVFDAVAVDFGLSSIGSRLR